MAAVSKNADGTFTITVLAREQRAMNRLATETSQSDAEMLADKVTHFLRSTIDRFRERDSADMQTRYDRAGNTIQNQIDQILAPFSA